MWEEEKKRDARKGEVEERKEEGKRKEYSNSPQR
jgi:hypothetical protein